MKLNSNEELRGELKQFINMDQAFNKKLSTFAPSSKSTLAVFSALGINAPVPAPVQTPAPIAMSKTAGFFVKFGQGIYSGLLASAVTAALFLGFFGNSIFNKENSNLEAGNLQNNKITNQAPPTTIIENKMPVTDSRSFDKKPQIKTKIVYAPVEKVPTVNNNLADNIQNVSSQSIVESEKKPVALLNNSPVLLNSKTNLIDSRNNEKYILSEPLSLDLKPLLKAFSINEPIGLTVEIKGGQYWQLQNTPITQSSIPNFYNIGISVGYRISDNLSLGADIRNEYYYQQFEGVDDIGDKYMYRQYPNYTSVTAGCKWNFLNFESFRTYTQIMAGGTLTGYVGRAVLGFEYSPQPEYKFIVGIEGSCLGYSYQGNTFYSPKFGMNYGVAFNF
jgi:hypothetical protein